MMLLALMIGASACGAGPVSDGCEWVRPIRPTMADVDVMSDALAGQILAHNEAGAGACGWVR